MIEVTTDPHRQLSKTCKGCGEPATHWLMMGDDNHSTVVALCSLCAQQAGALLAKHDGVAVATCADPCPFSACGEEWSPYCKAARRRLPKGHDPDGPPPKWCPLPIAVTR